MTTQGEERTLKALRDLTAYFKFMIGDPSFNEYVNAVEAIKAAESTLPNKQGESGEQAIKNELTKRHAEKSDYRDFRKLGYIAALIDVNNYIDMVESDPKIRVSAFALREFMKNKINEKSNSQSEAF